MDGKSTNSELSLGENLQETQPDPHAARVSKQPHPRETLQKHGRSGGHKCHSRPSQEGPGWPGTGTLKIQAMTPMLRAALR